MGELASWESELVSWLVPQPLPDESIPRLLSHLPRQGRQDVKLGPGA